jgi:hypothetical protein
MRKVLHHLRFKQIYDYVDEDEDIACFLKHIL